MKNIKFVFIVLIFCGIFGLAESSSAAEPETYYVDDNNCSDDYAGTSIFQPLCTFAEAMTKLQAGDTLIIKDGTYYQTLNVTVSGSQGSPITIKTENDGKVTVDGQDVRRPLNVSGKNYINIEGIVFRNSVDYVVYIYSSSDINIKRVSAYEAGAVGNNHQILIYVSSYILLEDCAVSGRGRDSIDIQASNNVTVRRCYIKWVSKGSNSSTVGACLVFYQSSDNLVENSVCIIPDNPDAAVVGFDTQRLSTNGYSNENNKFYGNVVINAKDNWSYSTGSEYYIGNGTIFKHNVAIDGKNTVRGAQSNDGIYENFTAIGTGQMFTLAEVCTTCGKQSGFVINGILKNSYFQGGSAGLTESQTSYVGTLTHSYNKFYDVSTLYFNKTAGAGEEALETDPYTTNYATYGKGAYLMVPPALKGRGEGGADIGATVLYRYQDGVLTSTPLWPWPMEDRIKNETSISVTYASNGGLWGGTWEATKDWNEIYGGSSDATPPAAPQGLLVQ